MSSNLTREWKFNNDYRELIILYFYNESGLLFELRVFHDNETFYYISFEN